MQDQESPRWAIDGLRTDSLASVLATVDEKIASDNPELIVWVRLDDLSCGSCLDDFAVISSIVHSASGPKKVDVLYLVEMDHRPLEILKRVVGRWKQIHSISSPVYVVKGFDRLNLRKSCVLIRERNAYVSEYMPMSYEKRGMIISRIHD